MGLVGWILLTHIAAKNKTFAGTNVYLMPYEFQGKAFIPTIFLVTQTGCGLRRFYFDTICSKLVSMLNIFKIVSEKNNLKAGSIFILFTLVPIFFLIRVRNGLI